MTSRTRSLLLLHGVVVIFGFTGILGKLITIEAEPLVFWRVLIGGASTSAWLFFRKKWRRWSVKAWLKSAAVGWIVAAHWVTFFAAIKVSSVGLALTMLATAPMFVGFIEPLVFHRRIAWKEVWLGAIVFVGVAMVFKAEQNHIAGIGLGLLSAVLAALFSTLNGRLVRDHEPEMLSAVELLSAAVGMGVWIGLKGQFDRSLIDLQPEDWVWILVLSLVATSFAFMASIQVLQQLTPFESAMAINMEPIYAILLASWLFGERFDPAFYFGAALVIGAVFMDTWLRRNPPKKVKPRPDHQ